MCSRRRVSAAVMCHYGLPQLCLAVHTITLLCAAHGFYVLQASSKQLGAASGSAEGST